MATPRTIGRFQIEGEHAAGGGGTVYSGRDPTNGMAVAVKLIRGLGTAETARFRREADTLANLRHPGVVRYIEHGQTDTGAAFLVMEWLDGEDLRARLSRGPLSYRDCAALGQRVASALGALHAQRIVHRDIKPGNIFLPGGRIAEATLVDFGLARADNSGFDTDVTATGVVVGTPAYMAPEQARGLRGIDGRADLFSLGCVLYRCIAGKPPFDGKHIVAVLTKVILEHPVALREVRQDVPPPLADLVMRLLEKDPDRRPASALVAARALSSVAESLSSLPDETVDDIEPPASSRSGLTTSELRVAAVLMVSGTARPADADDKVRAVAGAHGGRADALRDGTLVITVHGESLVSDQAARVADIAVAIRTMLPQGLMAIATGRAEVGGPQLIGDALERAAHLLESEVTRARTDPARETAVIAVDEVSAALLDPRFEVLREGERIVLGGARASETPARTVLGRVTPMLGREWEMRSIESFFRECVEDPAARPVLVTGAAGMGKSRLAHEAVKTLRRKFPDVEVWWGQGDQLRRGSALSVLGQIVRSAAGIPESDPPEARRQRLGALVKARVTGRDAPWVLLMLAELAGAPFHGEVSPALRAARQHPRAMSDQIGPVFRALVSATCGSRPLLLVVNDLQWVDGATVHLLGATISALPHLPWLVLGLARPEVHEIHPGLWNQHALQEIRLRPLTKRASVELARDVLGDNASNDTIEQIVARADGNAFYLEELIRAVGENRRRGTKRGPLPDTVLGMVQARLAELGPEARRVLRAASVFGETFWVGGVMALLGGSLPRASVDAMVQREIVSTVQESRFPGEIELSFRHALMCEGAYAMLTETDRVTGHALAAEWLAEHGEPDPMVLARHYELGAEPAQASKYLLQAARTALGAGDIETAVSCAERAQAHATTDPARVECLTVLGESAVWRLDWPAVDTCSAELTRIARKGSAEWFQALGYRLTMASSTGRLDLFGEVVADVMGAAPLPAPRTAPSPCSRCACSRCRTPASAA
ncbi:MAG: protein kinase [Polyangiaceae bacterium]